MIEITPKQKAKELVDKFEKELYQVKSAKEMTAQICALIAVDEIIQELEQLRKPEYTTFVISYDKEEVMDGYEKVDYWEQVKEEIKNL